MAKQVKPPIQAKRKYKTVPCPDCGDSKKPGLDPEDYSKYCGTCKGKGTLRRVVK